MEEATTLKCACADCGEIIKYPPSKVGQVVKCPKCGEASRLPPAASPASPEDTEEESDNAQPRTCPKCGSRLGRREVTCSSCEARREATRATLIRLGIGIVCLIGVVAVLVVVRKRSQPKSETELLTPSQPMTLTQPKPKVPKSLNDLQILKFTIIRNPDSDTSRIVGDIQNSSDYLRRNVKVSIDVLDENGMKIETLTEFTTQLPKNSTWHVIATANDPRAKAVRVSGLNEDF